MKKILFILVSIPLLVMGQTTTENYTKATTYRGAGATNPSVQVTYFDGLGRPVQQIANAQSNSGKDIVTHMEYDAFGRQTKEYLPYPSTQNNTNYIDGATAKSVTLSHYQGLYGDSNPYSEKLMENSPLNTVLKQAAPGNSWAMGSGHEIKMDYQTNLGSGTGAVKYFKATATWSSGSGMYTISISDQGVYAANELYKTVTKDEHWTTGDDNTTQEFKNKSGQVVLKRTFNSGKLETYYVYDPFGNLTYVIPPLAEAAIDQTTLDGLCYQYQYDARNRLAAKKLPGKQWEYIVYDKQDRPVATGPAFSPWGDSTIGMLITQYDAFGRVTQTGWKVMGISESNRATYQTNMDTGTNSFVLGTDDILTKNYYDNYAFLNGLVTLPTTVEGQAVATGVKGQATGSWVRILTLPTEQLGETSYTLYDIKYRPIRTESKNYLGGYTLVDTQLDFMGKTQYTITRHNRDGNTELVITDTFEYTAQDRLALHKQQIGSKPEQLIVSNTYDELGQLISKNVGGEDATGALGLQKVDYTYNIRGWMKGINNIVDLVQGSDPTDLFAFHLSYDEFTYPNTYDIRNVTLLYNGNISQAFWRTSNDNVLRQYNYDYDKLNRLTNASYSKTGISTTNSYAESLSYDKNGNIQTLNRTGEYDDLNYAMSIDDLTYVYDDNNRNQLNTVFDSTNNLKGFKDDTDGLDINNDGVDYLYDANGNMTKDTNKGIKTIKYNHLNLPTEIGFEGTTTGKINYIYSAVGQKMQKKVTDPDGEVITDYLGGGFQYKNTLLEFFPHAEGYVNVNKGSLDELNYVFNYTDHLGNVRVTYGVDPSSSELKIMEENNYYPFGLKHANYNMDKVNYEEMMSGGTIGMVPVESIPYKYKYNGKELQDELGLYMYDYGSRLYDPARAGWSTIDPLAEQGRRWSPYNYCFDNPISFTDPDGMWPYPAWMGKVQSFARGAYNAAGNMVVGLAKSNTYSTLKQSYGEAKKIAAAYEKGGLSGAAKQYANSVYETSGAKGIVENVKEVAKGNPEAIGALVTNIAAVAVLHRAGTGGASATVGEVTAEAGGAASKANTLRANRAQGVNFENQVQAGLEGSGNQVASQVTIEAANGTRTRPDFVSVNSEGTIGITEAKSSATAPLTPNQRTAFPLIEQSGGTVRGNNGNSIGLPAGTIIPATPVNVVRP